MDSYVGKKPLLSGAILGVNPLRLDVGAPHSSRVILPHSSARFAPVSFQEGTSVPPCHT